MTTVRFLTDYDYRPDDHLTIAYRAGFELEVEDECAERAIAAGAAVEIEAE